MLTTDQIASLDKMLDTDMLARRRAEYDAVQQRQQHNAAALAAAEVALRTAEAARSDLLAKAAQGDAVPPQAAIAADRKVHDAGAHLSFLRDTAAVLTRDLERADEAMNAVHHASAAAMAAHGAAEYLAAAVRHDAARAALARAEAAIDAAADMIRYAQGRGFRLHVVVGSQTQSLGFAPEYGRVFPTAAVAREQMDRAGLLPQQMEKVS